MDGEITCVLARKKKERKKVERKKKKRIGVEATERLYLISLISRADGRSKARDFRSSQSQGRSSQASAKTRQYHAKESFQDKWLWILAKPL